MFNMLLNVIMGIPVIGVCVLMVWGVYIQWRVLSHLLGGDEKVSKDGDQG